MKAVKGYTKHDYTMICKEEGGEVFSFASIDEAAGYFSMFGHEVPTNVALDGILNDTNCDWIVLTMEALSSNITEAVMTETLSMK